MSGSHETSAPLIHLAGRIAVVAERLVDLAAPLPETSRLAECAAELVGAAEAAGATQAEGPALGLLLDRAEEIIDVAGAVSQQVVGASGGEWSPPVILETAARELRSIRRSIAGAHETVETAALTMSAPTLEGELARLYVASSYSLYSTVVVLAPHTTIEDLLRNTAAVRETASGRLGYSYLWAFRRVHPGTALAARAERDGLLVDGAEAARDERLHGRDEPGAVPWRFRLAATEAVSALICRIQADGRTPEDTLAAKVSAWTDSLPDGRSLPISVARAVVRAAAELGDEVTIDDLMSEAAARWADGREDDSLVRSRAPFEIKSSKLIASDHFARTDPRLFDSLEDLLNEIERLDWLLGYKPVRKVDYIDQRYVDSCRAHPDEFPNLRTFRSITARSPDAIDMFYGRDADDVAEAVRLTEQHESAPLTPAESIENTTALGVKLGYPACCARAFARDQAPLRGNSESILLARRLDDPGWVPPESKLFLRWYLPCSLTCEASAERTQRILDFVRERCAPELVAQLEENLATPFLLLLDKRSQLVDIRPDHEVSERFTYRAGNVAGDDARLAKVREGDTLILEEGSTTVLKQGRETAQFSVDGFLWWNEKVFHPRFWRQFLARKAMRNADQSGPHWTRSRRDGAS